MADKNHSGEVLREEDTSPEHQTVLARDIVWPEGLNLPTVARVQVPGWLDGRSRVSVGRADWKFATLEALETKFGHKPVSFGVRHLDSYVDLFFIAARAGADSLDLFAWARNEQEAIAFWTDYYELADGERPERVFLVPTRNSPSAGPLRWHEDIHEKLF